MEYGVIYLRICPPKGHPGEWIKYCHILSSTPTSFQQNVKLIVDDINSKYKEDIVIPMDLTVHPGCATKAEKVETIATDMYNQYCEMCERQGIPNSVRCVYSVGELSDTNADSLHRVYNKKGGYDDVMVKLGTSVSGSDDPGLFRI